MQFCSPVRCERHREGKYLPRSSFSPLLKLVAHFVLECVVWELRRVLSNPELTYQVVLGVRHLGVWGKMFLPR